MMTRGSSEPEGGTVAVQHFKAGVISQLPGAWSVTMLVLGWFVGSAAVVVNRPID